MKYLLCTTAQHFRWQYRYKMLNTLCNALPFTDQVPSYKYYTTPSVPDRKLCMNSFEVSLWAKSSITSQNLNTWTSPGRIPISMASIISFRASTDERRSRSCCNVPTTNPCCFNLATVTTWSFGRQLHNPSKFCLSIAATMNRYSKWHSYKYVVIHDK